MENDANWSLIFMVNIMTRSNDDSSFAVCKLALYEAKTKA